MLIAQDRAPLASDAGVSAPASSSASVPGDTTSMLQAPPATPVNSTPSRVEMQGIGLHLDPTSAPPATPVDGFTLGDLPSTPPIIFTPPATPVGDPGTNPGAPPAAPIGSGGSSTTMRTIHPGDRPNVELISSSTLKGTADRSNEVAPDPLTVGYTTQTPLIALVAIVAAAALAWWIVKRGRFSL